MDPFQRQFFETQRAAESTAQLAFAIWVVLLVAAVAVAVWIYQDAEKRGKTGLAAAILVIASALQSFLLMVCVLCAWILARPEKLPLNYGKPKNDLPSNLPPGIVAEKPVEETLSDLESDEPE